MQVRQTLIEDPSLAMVVPSIDIADNNGAITLSGNVASEEQKNSVEALVRETSGVVLVNNNLKVASSALSGADSDLSLSATSRNVDPSTVPGADSSLSELFRATSETNYLSPELSLTSRSNASTGVYSGVQSGSASNQVDSMSEQLSQTSQQDTTNNATVPLTATSRPRDQSGGVDVNVQGSSAVDRTLGQQISQELKADASLASAISQVRISVDNGRVTLQGTVKNDVQKHEIESAVQRATGVSSVDNQLRISASGSPALERIYHEPQSQ